MVKTKVLYLICLFLMISVQSNAQDGTIMYISKGPEYKGNLKKFIQKHICYPESAIKDSVQGRVMVMFIVDTSGMTINHTISKGIRKDLDDEALRVARLIRFETPAMQKKVAIKVPYTVPIDFVLPKK